MKKKVRIENEGEFLFTIEVAQPTLEEVLELLLNDGIIQYSSYIKELSVLERNYQITFIRLSGMLPGIRLLLKTRKRMVYIPDERLRTLKTIGKISLGLSPP